MAKKVLAKGIDVSTWQGTGIDWNMVKSAGYDFAIIRIGFGKVSNQLDNAFEVNYKNAKAAGMPIGVYHYAYAVNVAEAEQEAKVCIEWMKGRQFEYPVFYDMEDSSIQGLGKRTLTDIAKKFMSTVANAGYWVGLYTNPNWLSNKLYADELKEYDTWLAMWNDVDTYNGAHTMWQYTSNGSVPGISGRVDMNVSYFDYPTAIKAAGKNGYSGTPTPTPSNVYKITGSGVRLRSDARTDANIIAVTSLGDTVKWLADDKNGWSKVEYKGKVGWMTNLYINKSGLSKYPIGTCNGTYVNVRSGPSTNSRVIKQINTGKKFTVICIRADKWLNVEIDGIEAYIYYDRSYISVAWG